MSTKHTPGPWRVESRSVMAKKAKQICEIPCYGVVHGKVDEANAHLIAAAPALLMICEQLIACHDEPTCPAVDLAKAIVKSAKGEA